MKIEKVKNTFLESSFQDFDTINLELNNLHTAVQESEKNNYKGLLYSNSKITWLKTLKSEELFFMNMHDKQILAILNISIYEAIINTNYETLYNGIYTYNRLRILNRLHLSGFKFHETIESLIFNNNDFLGIDNPSGYLLRQFMEYLDVPNGNKFDMELIQLLERLNEREDGVETNFQNLLKLHSKCRWLTRGWYRECNLINYMPIFLVGIYKLINRTFDIETDNERLKDFIHYLAQNKNKKTELVYTFNGKIDFLNDIIGKRFEEFQREYKNKCHCR